MSWAMQLLGDTIEHWEKRNIDAIADAEPRAARPRRAGRVLRAVRRPARRAARRRPVRATCSACPIHGQRARGARRVRPHGRRVAEPTSSSCSRDSFYFGCEADDRGIVDRVPRRRTPAARELQRGARLRHRALGRHRHRRRGRRVARARRERASSPTSSGARSCSTTRSRCSPGRTPTSSPAPRSPTACLRSAEPARNSMTQMHARRRRPRVHACADSTRVCGDLHVGGASARVRPRRAQCHARDWRCGDAVISGFTSFDPDVIGYEQSEVVLSGTASAYEPSAPLGTDGKYSVAATSTAPYTTRAVVMRPIKPRRFNGTVVVEWLNVSGGADAGPTGRSGTTNWCAKGSRGSASPRRGRVWTRSSRPLRRVAIRSATPTCRIRVTATRTTSSPRPAKPIRDNAAAILGGLKPKHDHRGRRVAVGGPSGHLHRRGPPARRRLRRLPRAQPHGRRLAVVAGSPAERAHPDAGADPRRPRRPGARVPNRDRRLLQQPERPPARHQHVPPVGGRGNRALRLLRAEHRTAPTPATVRARSRCSRRCRTPPTSRARASPATRRSTPGRRTTCSTPRSTGSTGGWPRASCRRLRLASRPPG